jgi:hypothetical protein
MYYSDRYMWYMYMNAAMKHVIGGLGSKLISIDDQHGNIVHQTSDHISLRI